MTATGTRTRGRPRAEIDTHRVVALRESDLSWRAIAKTLGVGTATAIRAYNAISRVPKASQNSRLCGEVPKPALEPPGDDFEKTVPWAGWKAESLNSLFQELGASKRLGRITVETVRHGERTWSLRREPGNRLP
jgi:hypothetical protein